MIINDYESFIQYIDEDSGCDYGLSMTFYQKLREFGPSCRWPKDYYFMVGMIDAIADIEAFLDITGNLDSVVE